MPQKPTPDYSVLIDQLLDTDEKVRRRALARLKRAPDSELVELLTKAIAISSQLVRSDDTYDDLHFLRLKEMLNILQGTAPMGAIEPIACLLSHKNEWVRRLGALALGEFAREQCVPHLLRALRDPDAFVQTGVVQGISSGAKKERCPETFRTQLFAEVATKLDDAMSGNVAQNAIAALLNLDRKSAVPILLSERYFSADYRHIWELFQHFELFQEQIPEDKLLVILPHLQEKGSEIPYCWAYPLCIKALARGGSRKAFDVITQSLDAGIREHWAGRTRESGYGYLHVIEGLTLLGDERVVPYLRALSKNGPEELRSAAADALTKSGKPS